MVKALIWPTVVGGAIIPLSHLDDLASVCGTYGNTLAYVEYAMGKFYIRSGHAETRCNTLAYVVIR